MKCCKEKVKTQNREAVAKKAEGVRGRGRKGETQTFTKKQKGIPARGAKVREKL